MKTIIRSIPNTLTLCNLLCGCFAITCAVDGELHMAFWAIVTAAVFDFFDGFAARMLRAYSPIGADLDSLADMVSFGLAPAFIWFEAAEIAHSSPIWSYAAFLLAAFAALRLAKFNNDTRQSEEFRGLPTPAMALFIVSAAVAYTQFIVFYPWAWAVAIVLMCGLMVCDIPMFSFKFKTFGFKKNALRYFFALFTVLSVILLGYGAPFVVITAYVIVSLIRLKSRV